LKKIPIGLCSKETIKNELLTYLTYRPVEVFEDWNTRAAGPWEAAKKTN